MDILKISLPRRCSKPWDDMLPSGCGRACESCERTVHDLSQMSARDIERLIESEPKPCVRAEVRADDSVKIREGDRASRLIVASIGTAAALLAGGCQTVPQQSERGAIVGSIDRAGTMIVVTALGADGKRHRTKVKPDGRYRIRNLPPGAYSLTFATDCGPGWAGETVVVTPGENQAATTTDTSSCIYIGMVSIDNRTG